MKNKALFVVATMILGLLAACSESRSGLHGTYEAKTEATGIRIAFQGEGKARVTLFNPAGEGELSHNTVYTVDGTRLHFTTNDPMGAPMDLVYENGVLSDGAGMVFEKK